MINKYLTKTKKLYIFIITLFCPIVADANDFHFVFMTLNNDPNYTVQKRYTGLKLNQSYSPIFGAKMAIKESRILSRSLGVNFKLIEKSATSSDHAIKIINNLHSRLSAKVFLLDLPPHFLQNIVKIIQKKDIIFFNIRNKYNQSRNKNCNKNLYHTIPSYRMLTDALAQFLSKNKWKKVFILRGPLSRDNAYANSFLASAKRLNLEITGDKSFTLSNDPRQRQNSNIKLLTSNNNYDVIFVADYNGEFSRYIPYNTFLARPIIGTEGLKASSWHWTWERHGAPQLNQRFRRLIKNRPMSEEDWAAWVGVKSIINTIAKIKSINIDSIKKIISTPSAAIDTYKGNPSSFRLWNNQLRQPILLHTFNAVIDRAPLNGFIHIKNNLDTLGYDEGETQCELDG